MFGVTELLVLAFMVTTPGGYGIPVGIAPGTEDVYLHEIAPEDCLMYASWSGTSTLDPEENPTEKYLAQEEIQAFLSKLKLEAAQNKKWEGSESSQAYRELIVKLPEMALTQPCCYYVDKVRWLDDRDVTQIAGAFVIRLDDREAEIKRLVEAIDEVPSYDGGAWSQNVLSLLGGYFGGIAGERKFEVQENYLVIAFAGDGMDLAPQRVQDYAKAGEPQWLVDLKLELPVDRRSSISMLNLAKLNEFLDVSNNSDITSALDQLGAQNLKRVGWVTGLDETGYVCRTTIHCDRKNGSLMDVVDLAPLDSDQLRGIHRDRDFVFATRLSTERLYSIVENLASEVGERDSFETQIADFEAFSGVSLREDLINEIDDYVFFYGDFRLPDFEQTLVVGIGIRDEMSFSGTLENFSRRIKEVVGADDLWKMLSHGNRP